MAAKFDLEQYLFDKAKITGRPARAVLELTPVCNFDCEICYVRLSPKEAAAAGGLRDNNFWLSLIPEMKKMGVLIVTLIGGEPLLFDGFSELYQELIDQGFLVNVTTNGSVISDKIIDLFTERPPRYVTVSLYGASNESYEKVTGSKNGFSRTIEGIERMLQAGIPVKLNYLTSPDNAEDLDAIYQIKDKYKLPLLADSYCLPPVRKLSKDNSRRISPVEAAGYKMKIRKKDDQEYYIQYRQRIAEGRLIRNEALHQGNISCYAGSAVFWVNWHGNMMPCGFLEQMSVPIESGGLEAAWEELKQKVSAVKTSSKCSSCENREICHVCSAAMYCETGSFEEAPSYLCEMTDEIVRIAKSEE